MPLNRCEGRHLTYVAENPVIISGLVLLKHLLVSSNSYWLKIIQIEDFQDGSERIHSDFQFQQSSCLEGCFSSTKNNRKQLFNEEKKMYKYGQKALQSSKYMFSG